MGQKITCTEVRAQQTENYEPKESQIIYGINLNEFDNIIEGLIPNNLPSNMKESLIKRIKICKFSKKIYKQIDCTDCRNKTDIICGIRYYLAFASIKNDDNTINFAYFFVYNKKEVEKSHRLTQKGDKAISKIYYNDLDEVNRIFQLGKSKESIQESINKFEEAKIELSKSS